MAAISTPSLNIINNEQNNTELPTTADGSSTLLTDFSKNSSIQETDNSLTVSQRRSFGESPKIVQSEAAKLRSKAIKNRQIFGEYVKFCRRNSLRTKLTKTEFDYETLFGLDHCYSVEKGELDVSSSNSLNSSSNLLEESARRRRKNRFYRELFFTQYSRLIFGEAEVLLNDLDVVEESSKKSSATISSTSGKFENVQIPEDTLFLECEKWAEKLKEVIQKFEPSLNDENSESYSSTGKSVDGGEELNWQEKMKRSVSPSVWKILEKLIKILFDEILVKRATMTRKDQSNIRENNRNKNANRLRLVFADILEDRYTLHSVHSKLVHYLPVDLLAVYLELWKILKAKVPEVVSFIHEIDPKCNQTEKSKAIYDVLKDCLGSNLAQPVDITDFSATQLAKGPIFVLISPLLRGLGRNNQPPDRCQQFFKNLLPQLGTCFEIKFSPFKNDMSMLEVNDKLFDYAHERLLEIMKAYPSKHIILVGWDASCLIAAMLTLHYSIAACICFGFPNVTINGLRGDVDDDILNIKCPILFVVGQFSTTCSIDDLKDTCDHMSSKNVGLVVVGGANNDLKVSHSKLCTENVTQRIVDKCILDNVAEFLNDVLISLPDISLITEQQSIGHESQHSIDEPEAKRKCVEQKTDVKISSIQDTQYAGSSFVAPKSNVITVAEKSYKSTVPIIIPVNPSTSAAKSSKSADSALLLHPWSTSHVTEKIHSTAPTAATAVSSTSLNRFLSNEDSLGAYACSPHSKERHFSGETSPNTVDRHSLHTLTKHIAKKSTYSK